MNLIHTDQPDSYEHEVPTSTLVMNITDNIHETLTSMTPLKVKTTTADHFTIYTAAVSVGTFIVTAICLTLIVTSVCIYRSYYRQRTVMNLCKTSTQEHNTISNTTGSAIVNPYETITSSEIFSEYIYDNIADIPTS